MRKLWRGEQLGKDGMNSVPLTTCGIARGRSPV